MNCFPCFSRSKTHSKETTTTTSREINASPSPANFRDKAPAENKNKKEDLNKVENGNIAAQTFTFRELATATKNFRPECLLGEGGFGRVYKATLESSRQVVAVKQLDRNGLQGNKEFLVEVLMLSLLHHQNLVNLIGYCADGDQRLLVYEYMSGGSLEDHLLDIGADQKPLDWFTRMKIALGAARGLEYLHDKANPPVIYRDFKSSNILLDEDFNPKLSDFGLAKLGSVGDKIHVSSRVMGTYGYCAPEYARAGELTLKSDVYSFGVVLLELITGRRAIDTTRPTDQQNLVTWAQPIFKDPKRFPDMADPLLNRQFTESGLNQAVAIAAMCLQEEAQVRPLISDVVTALSFLSIVPDGGLPTPLPVSQPVSQENHVKEIQENSDNKKIDHQDHHGHHDNDSSDQDTDSESDESDESDEDEQSAHVRQRAVTEAKEWALNSSHRSSRGSNNGSKPSSRNSSKKIQDGSLSSSHNSSHGISSPDGSVSSRGKSNRVSQLGSTLISSHNGNIHSKDGSVSLSHKSSRKSQDENVSFSHNNSSRKAQNETGVSLSANSTRGTQDERVLSIQKSSRKSLDESGVSLSSNSSTSSSEDGSVFSLQKSSREPEDGSVSSIRQLSHKKSTKSQNERVSFNHKLSHKLSHQRSRGSQDGSVSSSTSSSRSGSGRVSSLPIITSI